MTSARTSLSFPAPRIRLAHPDIGEEELCAIQSVLQSGVLTNGPFTRRFEEDFARRHQVAHGIAFANGTIGLTAIHIALGIQPGDEVIVPSLTFISSATSVIHAGATPVFADIDDETYNIDPVDVATRITSRTRAIVAVHYGGQAADMVELRDLADKHGLYLIEDAAEAHGATYRDRSVGGLADAAMFSFTPTKNITTGEGGMVTTDDGELADRLRLLRNHGQTDVYQHEALGYNWRITEMQAAMGVVQLSKLDAILERKARNAVLLASALDGTVGLTLPVTRLDRSHGHMLYTLRMDAIHRTQLREAMAMGGIQTRLYFPPAHQQPVFRHLATAQLPVTERLAHELLSIPFHSRLTNSDLLEIVQVITGTLGTAGFNQSVQQGLPGAD